VLAALFFWKSKVTSTIAGPSVYFKHAGGAERFDFFKKVVSVPDARKTTLTWSFDAFHKTELWVALITFL
jgi:hypothetical protein